MSHMALTTLSRLVDPSSSNPIRWPFRADPGQKHDPGERMLAKKENEGLTNQGPLQKRHPELTP